MFNGGVYLFLSIGINMGYDKTKVDADSQKQCTIIFPWHMGKYKYKYLCMGINITWFLIIFKISCPSLCKIWNMLRQLSYLDDMLILTNNK
jgi:hypothetical protein